MPKYMVTKKSWLDLADPLDKSGTSPRLVKPGQVIEFKGPAGSSLELLEEEDAKVAVADAKAAADAAAKSGNPSRAEYDALLVRIAELEGKGKPKAEDESSVEIPPDWESMSAPKRIALARKLGAPPTTNAEAANEYIAAEVKRRAAAPPAAAPATSPPPVAAQPTPPPVPQE